MHQFRKEGLNPAWEKPAKTERARKVHLFIPNLLYWPQPKETPYRPWVYQYKHYTGFNCTLSRGGKDSSLPGTRKPEKTALHANNHSEPCLLHSMILAGFSFVYSYISMCVCMYKNRAPVHCRHIGVDMNALQSVCVCCKKSLNVCGFSKSFHTTGNI